MALKGEELICGFNTRRNFGLERYEKTKFLLEKLGSQ
jgi:hypothetical protein